MCCKGEQDLCIFVLFSFLIYAATCSLNHLPAAIQIQASAQQLRVDSLKTVLQIHSKVLIFSHSRFHPCQCTLLLFENVFQLQLARNILVTGVRQ